MDCNGGGEVNCLICWENVGRREGKVVQVPSELGGRPEEAFLRICEVLEVPYSEIQGEWRFPGGGGGGGSIKSGAEKLPFCLVCLKGFESVVRLQRQLSEIQKKIEGKIAEIRGKIRGTSNKRGGGAKEANFWSKALARDQGTSAVPSISASPQVFVTSNTPLETLWPLWSHEASPVAHSQQSTPANEENLTPAGANNYANLLQDSQCDNDNCRVHTDDYFGPQDESNSNTDEDSSGSDHNPKTPPKPSITSPQKNYSFLPSAFRRLQTSRQIISRARKTERQAEYFSAIEKDSQGQMFYEGILITPIKGAGYRCGQCHASIGKAQDSISLRKTKIHIKGFHLGAYKCSLCSKNFSSNDILHQHLSRFHEGAWIPCPTCGKPIRDRCLKDHQFTHMNASEKEASGYQPRRLKEPTHSCRICEKMFRNRTRLQRHELTHVDPVFRKDFKCPHCDTAFTTSQAKSEHILRFHESLNVRKRLCTICNESVFPKDLSQHMAKHNQQNGNNSCRYCKKRLTARRLPLHEERCKNYRTKREGLEFGCDICNKYFKDHKALYTHRLTVHKIHAPKCLQDVSVDNPEEGEFLEELNDEGIQHVEGNIYAYQLYQLEKMEAGRGGGYKCVECKEELGGGDEDLEERVKEHVRSKHIGNFRCNKCTKRMKTLFQVQVHQRLEHSNLESFDCDICGRIAIPGKSFKKHLWLHKNVWEVAECINMGYSFPLSYSTCDTQEALKQMGVEVNLRCGVCGESDFDKVEDLYSHRRKDHSEIPVVPFPLVKEKKKPGKPSKYPDGPIDCPICGKRFVNKERFLDHRYKVHDRKKKRKGQMEEATSEEEIRGENEGQGETIKQEVTIEEEVEEDDGLPEPTSQDLLDVRRGESKINRNENGCNHCGKILTRRRLPEHEEKCGFIRSQRTIENGYIFECEVCQARFKIRKDLQSHRRNVHHLGGIIRGTTVNVRPRASKRNMPTTSALEGSKSISRSTKESSDPMLAQKISKVMIVADEDTMEDDEVGVGNVKIETDPLAESENSGGSW